VKPQGYPFPIKFYSGTSVYLLNQIRGVPEEKRKPIKSPRQLRTGLKLFFQGLIGYRVGLAKKTKDGWIVDTGSTIGYLEFNKDDRKCCTVCGEIGKLLLKSIKNERRIKKEKENASNNNN
jgi:hypothetical protein